MRQTFNEKCNGVNTLSLIHYYLYNGGQSMPKKLTYQEVKSYIQSFNGYKLLSEEYINNVEKLILQCPQNHIYKTNFKNFKQGHGCNICAKKKYGAHKKFSYNYVKNYIEKQKYKLITKENEYVNTRNKLKIQCPQNHIFYITFNGFKNNGTRCRKCYNKFGRSKSIRFSYNYVKNYIESFNGYKLLSEEYKNVRTKLSLQCPEGHTFEMTYSRFKQGQRCPICFYESTSSKPEREIQDFISNIYDGVIISNDRNTIINPQTGWNLELDVYLPELNKAIEFNGSYWHSLPTNNDKVKSEQCRNNNIKLLVVNEEN